MSDAPPPGDEPTFEEQLWLVSIAAQHFVECAAIFAPVTTDSDARLPLTGGLLALAEDEAAWAAQQVCMTLRRIPEERAPWLAEPRVRNCFPGYISFLVPFRRLVARWGFASTPFSLREGRTKEAFYLQDLNSLIRPLRVASIELDPMRRGAAILQRLFAGAAIMGNPRLITTNRGPLRFNPDARDRIAVELSRHVVTVDGVEHQLNEQQTYFVHAIAETKNDAITFAQMEAKYPQLTGGNETRIRTSLPAPIQDLIGRVKGYWLRGDDL